MVKMNMTDGTKELAGQYLLTVIKIKEIYRVFDVRRARWRETPKYKQLDTEIEELRKRISNKHREQEELWKKFDFKETNDLHKELTELRKEREELSAQIKHKVRVDVERYAEYE
jgi:predicted  nucleic acid-binding Zn-ribbon protein